MTTARIKCFEYSPIIYWRRKDSLLVLMILVGDAFTFLPSHIFYRLSFSVLLILVDDRQGREGIAWDRDEISERAMYTNLDDVRCRVLVHEKHRGAVTAYSGKSHDFSSASDETTRTTRVFALSFSHSLALR